MEIKNKSAIRDCSGMHGNVSTWGTPSRSKSQLCPLVISEVSVDPRNIPGIQTLRSICVSEVESRPMTWKEHETAALVAIHGQYMVDDWHGWYKLLKFCIKHPGQQLVKKVSCASAASAECLLQLNIDVELIRLSKFWIDKKKPKFGEETGALWKYCFFPSFLIHYATSCQHVSPTHTQLPWHFTSTLQVAEKAAMWNGISQMLTLEGQQNRK